MSTTPTPEPSRTAAAGPAGGRSLADLPEPLALLFDLDGTLVDTVGVRIEAWQRTIEEGGIPVDRSRLAGYIGSDGRWLAKEMARAVGRELDDATAETMDNRHGHLFDELNKSPRPLPGAPELLTALERSRLTFAVATSSQPGQVAVSVRALRLPAPPPIVDSGQVAQAKPAPDLLLAAARQLSVDPARCWYVGDSTWDMLASSRAAMPGVGVTTGAADAPALLGAGAAVAVESLFEIYDELRRRGLVGA